MSAAIHRHPRFPKLRDLFRTHPEWFIAWRGTLFRFQTVDFPAPKDVLSGEGASRRGGRWNPPGLAALYGSTTDTTALEECKAHDRYYGVETKSPRLLVAIEARLARVLDLANPAIRRAMDLTLAGLAAEDWRKLQAGGKESFTQAIGRAVAAAAGSGLLSRSAVVRRGVNVAIFPGACAGDLLEIVEGGKLAKLGAKMKARHLQKCRLLCRQKVMPTIARKSKTAHPALAGFRFSHRGAKDYAGLLQHYRTAFKMPQPVVVRLTGFSARSVAKWSEGVQPSPKQEKALVEMDRLLDGLSRVMQPDQIGLWLKQPNPAFDGSTPLQLVERGEMDRIWHMLYDLESGQPG